MGRNEGKGYKVFAAFNGFFMIFICIIMLFPYLHILAKAFNEGRDASMGGITIFPRIFTLENFKVILSGDTFKNALIVSVARVVLGVILGLFVQFSAAYALTRKKLPGKSFVTLLFAVSMFIHAGMIPTYVLYSQMELLNSFWVYIFPVLFSYYNVVIIRTFIQSTIPASLEESALIDGANEMIIFFKIIIPLSKPILATIALWIMVTHWNDWTTTLYYIKKPSLFTLQYVMMQIVKESERTQKAVAAALETGMDIDNVKNTTSEALSAAQVVVSTLPIICVYPFLQKYFVKGITLGAVKG